MDPKHHQLHADHRHPRDHRNPPTKMLAMLRKGINVKRWILLCVNILVLKLISPLLFVCRERKDKEKDEISRMPKAKDEQAPVSKITVRNYR